MQLVHLYQILIGHYMFLGGVQFELRGEFEVVEVGLVVGLHAGQARNAPLFIGDGEHIFDHFEYFAVHFEGGPFGEFGFVSSEVVDGAVLVGGGLVFVFEEEEAAVGHVVEFGADEDGVFEVAVEAVGAVPLLLFQAGGVQQLVVELKVLAALSQAVLQRALLQQGDRAVLQRYDVVVQLPTAHQQVPVQQFGRTRLRVDFDGIHEGSVQFGALLAVGQPDFASPHDGDPLQPVPLVGEVLPRGGHLQPHLFGEDDLGFAGEEAEERHGFEEVGAALFQELLSHLGGQFADQFLPFGDLEAAFDFGSVHDVLGHRVVQRFADVGVEGQSAEGRQLVGDLLVALAQQRDDPAHLADVVGQDQAANEDDEDHKDGFAHVGDADVPKADGEGDGGCPVDAEDVLVEPGLLGDGVLVHPVGADVDEGEAEHEGAHHVGEEEVGQQQFQQCEVLLLGVVVDENQVDYLLRPLEGHHVDQTGEVSADSWVDCLRVDYHQQQRQEQQQIEEAVGGFGVVFADFFNFVDLDAVLYLADYEIADDSDAHAHQEQVLEHHYPLVMGDFFPELLEEHLEGGEQLDEDDREERGQVYHGFDVVADFESVGTAVAAAVGVAYIGVANKSALPHNACVSLQFGDEGSDVVLGLHLAQRLLDEHLGLHLLLLGLIGLSVLVMFGRGEWVGVEEGHGAKARPVYLLDGLNFDPPLEYVEFALIVLKPHAAIIMVIHTKQQ